MTEEMLRKANEALGRLAQKFEEETGCDSALLFSRDHYIGHEPSYMLLLRDAVVQYPQNVTGERVEYLMQRVEYLMQRCESEVEMEIRDHRLGNS
jgi:hypothetical protein